MFAVDDVDAINNKKDKAQKQKIETHLKQKIFFLRNERK
jgi:hypothetical protein